MRRAVLATAGLAAVVAVITGVVIGSTGASSTAVGHSGPAVRPSDFSHPQANPYFPLQPGLVFRYHGTDGLQKFRERVTITHKTKMIQGVKATVVRDVLRRADGTLAESTRDYYAGDNSGNVWYLGEATATYDRHGNVKSREGSWQAGMKGGEAGLIMPANPRPTDAYRQEYWRGHAEDQAWIVQNNASVKVPIGTYHHVVRSYEWSRLEKRNISVKLYARGLGIISEHDVSGGTETFKLVSATHP
jgi:hypothetical protein